MKKFTYEARDQASDKIVKATVQADTEFAAARLLTGQGLIPLSIKDASGINNPFKKFMNRVTVKDKIIFTRQLATLIGAGLPLTQSLDTVASQIDNKQLKDIIHDVLASVEGGKSLADSFGRHKGVFGTIFLALVTAGEASGTLDQSLQRIALQQEKDAEVTSKIKGALTYPIIVLVVILGVVAFMLLTVVPQVETLYSDLGQQLPWITSLMVALADLLGRFWWIGIIGLIVLAYVGAQYIKTTNGIRVVDTFKLNVPIFKGLFRKLYMARFARTCQTLLATGVSMLDTLKISSEAVNNVVIQDSVMRAAEKVKGGKALSASLKSEDYILSLVPQMIRVGEQSGRMDDMMGRVAQVFENELDEEIRTISTMIEPVLMVVLAVVAGGMVAAILFPIYGLVNTAGV